MTVSIELTDNQAAVLQLQADRLGMSLQDYVQKIVIDARVPPHTIAHLQQTDPEEWKRQFEAWVNSHDPNTPVLSDEDMRRESIYPDRPERDSGGSFL